MKARNRLRAPALAVLVALAASALPDSFEPASIDVVTSPLVSEGLQLAVTLPPRPPGHAPSSVIAARVANRSGRPLRLMMTLDGAVMARSTVGPRAEAVVRALVPHERTDPQSVQFSSDQVGWALTSLEMANVYWARGGPFGLAVTPDASSRSPLVPAALVPLLAGLAW